MRDQLRPFSASQKLTKFESYVLASYMFQHHIFDFRTNIMSITFSWQNNKLWLGTAKHWRGEKYSYLKKKSEWKPNPGKRSEGELEWDQALGKHNFILNSDLPPAEEENIQCVLPVLTYGSETWCLAKDIRGKVEKYTKGKGEKNTGFNGQTGGEHHGSENIQKVKILWWRTDDQEGMDLDGSLSSSQLVTGGQPK